jgi:tol-pal system protein YbgF
MTRVTRFVFLAVASVALAWVALPARAESNSDRMDRLEKDMRQLQQDYYASQGGQSGGGQPGANQSEFMDRLSALEQSLRDLRGQVEESNYREKQMLDRLNALEQRTGTSGAAPSGTLGAPPAPPPGQSGDAGPSGAPTLGAAAPSEDRIAAEDTTPPPTDEKGQFDAAIKTLYQGNREGGIKALHAFIKAHPKSKQVPSAYYWLGEAQLADKAYRESAEAFLTVVTKYPKDPIAPKSLVKLGSALIAGGQAKEGCKQLKSIKEIFPKADKTIVEMANRERKLGNCA